MNARKVSTLALAALIALLAGAAPVMAEGTANDRDALKARFKERSTKLEALKKDGKVGETPKGILEAVKPEYLKDASLKSFLSDENSDRKKLFEFIAKDTGTTPEKVAVRFAARHYERAKPGEYLQDTKGKWYQKS